MAEELDMTRIPQHIAIIMDGNGRWATERGKERSYGHQAGVDTVRRITSECTRLGVKYLTLYTFSTENWNRPSDEVAALMGLVLTSLEDEIFMRNNVRFHVIGDIERLPKEVQDKLQETMDHTVKNNSMTMVVALSYSSRWELYFCNTYWPDFDEADLHKAIIDYQSRQRRFGKTEKQVETEQEKI